MAAAATQSTPTRGMIWCLALALLWVAWSGPRSAAQEQTGADRELKLTEMSLTDLLNMDFRVVSSVLGAHTHTVGEWMIGLRRSTMHMDGLRSGHGSLGAGGALAQGFAVEPTKMDMTVDMLSVMHSPLKGLTLMAMLPYKTLSMSHVTASGARFSTRAEGPGDLQLGAIIDAWAAPDNADHRVLINAGISLPSGSIRKQARTPAGSLRLPYPMQLGSGTFDLMPGVTYLDQRDDWAWGSQFKATVRLGRNSNRYRLGNRYELTTWATRRLSEATALTLRLDGQSWGNVHGSDPRLVRTMVPTANPSDQGGERIDLLIGFDIEGTVEHFEGQRLEFEFGRPVYQRLDGPQLELDWRASAGWKIRF